MKAAIIKIFKKIISSYLVKQYQTSIQSMFEPYYSKIIRDNIIPPIDKDNEIYKKWERKWSVFNIPVNPKAYQVYSHYIGDDENIVPNDIARIFIEPILTPPQYQQFYNDKNSLGQIFPQELLPYTVLRSINGTLYDMEYCTVGTQCFFDSLASFDRVIVKPALDMGGHGVQLFFRKGDNMINAEGEILTYEYMQQNYGKNYLIQKCLDQSVFMSQFNPTSVNTIRLAMYKDVNTGVIHYLGAVLRMGGQGSVVDNACSGGVFAAIDTDGKIGKILYDEFGRTKTVHNGIDFSNSDFVIPDFEKVIKMGEFVASRMPHMYLFANDFMIDEEGNVKIIEVNTQWFSYWLYQFSSKSIFGQYTDDVINYCKAKKHLIKISPSLRREYE